MSVARLDNGTDMLAATDTLNDVPRSGIAVAPTAKTADVSLCFETIHAKQGGTPATRHRLHYAIAQLIGRKSLVAIVTNIARRRLIGQPTIRPLGVFVAWPISVTATRHFS
jgi:hypothetical protein